MKEKGWEKLYKICFFCWRSSIVNVMMTMTLFHQNRDLIKIVRYRKDQIVPIIFYFYMGIKGQLNFIMKTI